jgi:hypothetical protein
MPADKLVLLSSQSVAKHFRSLAQEKGDRKWGYAKVVDLRKTDAQLPVMLYCDGYLNGINKIHFIDVAHLGLTRVREIATEIFGNIDRLNISRIDWCVDLGITLADLALYCRVARAQNCRHDRSRSGQTFYLKFSEACTIYMYDKLGQLKAIGDPIVRKFHVEAPWTRVEVQYKCGRVPVREFKHIERYAELDMLAELSFWEAAPRSEGVSPIQSLANEGLRRVIDEVGLQSALKRFSSQERAYIAKKFLRRKTDSEFPDLNALMKKSAGEWLSDVIRFPRFRERSSE